MDGSERCRLCSRFLVEHHSQLRSLFSQRNRKILRKIEQITGVELKKAKSLPEFYCNACESELDKACEFRERVLCAQKYFHSNCTHSPDDGKNYLNDNKNVEFVNLDDMAAMQQATEYANQIIEEQTSEGLNASLNAAHEMIKVEKQEMVVLDGEERLIEGAIAEFEEVIEEETELVEEMELEATVNKNINEAHYVKLKSIDEVTNDFATDIIAEEAEINADEYIINKLEHLDVEVDAEENAIEISTKTDNNKMKTAKTRKGKREKSTPVKFICDQCGNYFTCRHHFLTHLRRHAGDKPFECELCSDKFFTNSELNRHMRRHTGERPFSCRYCERTFTDYSTRIKHERTHTNERPFSCSRCPKSFTTSYILKNHMLTHTGERSFQCNLCNKAFQRQTHLVVHYRSVMHQQNEKKNLENICQQAEISSATDNLIVQSETGSIAQFSAEQ